MISPGHGRRMVRCACVDIVGRYEGTIQTRMFQELSSVIRCLLVLG